MRVLRAHAFSLAVNSVTVHSNESTTSRHQKKLGTGSCVPFPDSSFITSTLHSPSFTLIGTGKLDDSEFVLDLGLEKELRAQGDVRVQETREKSRKLVEEPEVRVLVLGCDGCDVLQSCESECSFMCDGASSSGSVCNSHLV